MGELTEGDGCDQELLGEPCGSVGPERRDDVGVEYSLLMGHRYVPS
jgi:hypothetical protein